MKLSQFNFNLPEALIASTPAKQRDESRLMVLDRKTGTIEHKLFKDILGYFDDGDVMILNNTKVFPARMYGNKEKTGARIEVFLLRELNAEQRLWDVLVDPARKIRIGNKLYFGDDELFIELLRIENGSILKQTDDTVYSVIDDYFAKRSFDTNGDYVSNKFNRLILYDASMFHKSLDYFGKDKYNGRLFQVFFFNTEINTID